MKLSVQRFASLALVLVPLWGCKKEVEQPRNSTTYLKFSDGNALNQAISEISRAKDKQAAVQRIIGVYAVGPSNGNFHSLLANPKKNVAVYMHGTPASLGKGNGQGSNQQVASRVASSEDILSDELVPDTNFAAVLNEDLEIQVGEQVFMISPEGTFFTDAFNHDALARMVNDTINNVIGRPIGDDNYDMGSGITRFDTYGVAEAQKMAMQETSLDLTRTNNNTGGNAASPCGIAQPNLSNFTPILPAQEYCNFPTYAYGAKTVVGGWLQHAFGVNTSRENEFDYNHRVWVKVYDFNYFVYLSVGVKAGFQKKGFIFWGSMRSPKIVVGWDAFIMERPMVYTLANPVQPPAFPGGQIGRVVNKELQKFKGFDVTTNVISETSSGLINKFSPWPVGKSDIEDDLRDMTGKGIALVTQRLWDYANNVYAPGQVAFQNSFTTSFRMMFPDKTVVVLSRWEDSDTNTEEINKVIDSNTCRVTFNGTLGGSIKFRDDILMPTFANKAYSYTINKVSAYGAVQYGGGWKGVRIIKN